MSRELVTLYSIGGTMVASLMVVDPVLGLPEFSVTSKLLPLSTPVKSKPVNSVTKVPNGFTLGSRPHISELSGSG
jgi:hypothetical protein